MKKSILAVVLVMVILAGCASTTIQKADGTTISHSSLFVNTKNVAMSDGNTSINIGAQAIDLDALESFLAVVKAAKMGQKP